MREKTMNAKNEISITVNYIDFPRRQFWWLDDIRYNLHLPGNKKQSLVIRQPGTKTMMGQDELLSFRVRYQHTEKINQNLCKRISCIKIKLNEGPLAGGIAIKQYDGKHDKSE